MHCLLVADEVGYELDALNAPPTNDAAALISDEEGGRIACARTKPYPPNGVLAPITSPTLAAVTHGTSLLHSERAQGRTKRER